MDTQTKEKAQQMIVPKVVYEVVTEREKDAPILRRLPRRKTDVHQKREMKMASVVLVGFKYTMKATVWTLANLTTGLAYLLVEVLKIAWWCFKLFVSVWASFVGGMYHTVSDAFSDTYSFGFGSSKSYSSGKLKKEMIHRTETIVREYE